MLTPEESKVDPWFLALLGVVAFSLNFAWEYAQCGPFFVHADGAPTPVEMFGSALGDVLFSGLAYIAAALTMRCLVWPFKEKAVKGWIVLEVAAVLIAIVVESWALAAGRWAYTPLAPLFPGTSLSVIPVLQLALLVPASVLVARFLRRRVFRRH